MLLFIALTNLIYAQEVVIWEEQFDGGIPESWTIGEGSPMGAVWQWSASGKADSAFIGVQTTALVWGDKGPIESPSVGNGAAMYNSDVYDTGGISFGAGPFPGQHSGTLTSPMVDLTNWPSVSLKFNQYASANGAAVSTLLDISTDGGNSWTNFPINETVVLNNSTSPDDVQLVDVSAVAGGQDSVQVRFTWDGRFYFWLIDDVQFIETPGNNLALGSKIHYPPLSYSFPGGLYPATMQFYADISNLGSTDQTNVVLKAWIDTPEGDILFSDSTVIDVLGVGVIDSTVHIDEVYSPGLLDYGGTYYVNYEVYSLDDIDGDFDPDNNSYKASFIATDVEFAKDDGLGIEGIGTDADWMYANVYQMNGDVLLDGVFKAASASFSAARNFPQEPINGETARILFFKVKDTVLPDWSNFDPTSIGEDDDLILLGVDTFQFPENYQNYQTLEVPLHNLSQNDQVTLEAGTRYILAIAYEGEANTILHGSDKDINYYQVSSIVYIDQWNLEGFGPGEAAHLRLIIDMVATVDDIPLSDHALELFPNPVRDKLNIDINLPKPQKALMILADTSGRVLTYKTFESIETSKLSFNMSKYPDGQYLIRLVTEQGTKTKSFIKTR